MRYLFIVSLSFLLMTACSSEQENTKNEIVELEKALAANPSGESDKTLTEKYMNYIQTYPEDTETNAAFLQNAANNYIKSGKYSMAVEQLMTAIKDYPAAKITPDNAWLLGSIYKDKLKSKSVAKSLYKTFSAAYPQDKRAGEALKLGGNDFSVEQNLKRLSQAMYNDSTGQIQFPIANDFINTSRVYVLLRPDAIDAPDHLHRAGETARSIRAFPAALRMYDWIIEKYPDSPKASQALFLKAFTLDNDMKNKADAKKIYEKFLQKYPNDEFADDTKFLLENIDKKDEEIIKQFK